MLSRKCWSPCTLLLRVLNSFGDLRSKFWSIVSKSSSLGGVFGMLKAITVYFASLTDRFHIPVICCAH